MMYLCNNCGAVFKSLKHYSYHVPAEMLPFDEWDGCPECSSPDCSEARTCCVCGGYMTEGVHIVGTVDYICNECAEAWEGER